MGHCHFRKLYSLLSYLISRQSCYLIHTLVRRQTKCAYTFAPLCTNAGDLVPYVMSSPHCSEALDLWLWSCESYDNTTPVHIAVVTLTLFSLFILEQSWNLCCTIMNPLASEAWRELAMTWFPLPKERNAYTIKLSELMKAELFLRTMDVGVNDPWKRDQRERKQQYILVYRLSELANGDEFNSYVSCSLTG